MATSENLPMQTASPVNEESGPPMTLVEHLVELRNRLIKASIALLITTALSFAFATYLVDIFTVPIGGRQALQAIDVTENMGVFMRVSLMSGVVLAMPVIVYQVLMFIVQG